MRDFHWPGRAEAYGDQGMVATSHPQAAIAARNVLAEGGTAADAAIAAAAVLCIAEPQMTGIGGDCFWMHGTAAGEIVAFNGSGRCPSGFRIEMLEGASRLAPTSVHTVTVPGAVDGWCALHERFGRHDLETLLAPAVRLARDGCVVQPRVALDWQAAAARVATGAARDLYLADGPLAAGQKHANPALAATLELIGRKGRAGFHEGSVAASMVRALTAEGGSHRLEDFAAHRGTVVTPISTAFYGAQVLECPPNGQGAFALLLMNLLMEAGGLRGSEAERISRFAALTELAYEERNLWCGDPDYSDLSVDRLLSPEHAQSLLARGAERVPRTLEPHRDTVYLSVVDLDLNCVSFINSIFNSFGSGIADKGTGVLFHNRGLGFSLDADHPAAIGAGRRPMHTIIPGLVCDRQGLPVMPFGVMGGQYQAAGHAAFLYRFLAEWAGLQEALDAPRSFAIDGKLQLEATIGAQTRAALVRLGHVIEEPALPIGGGQAIRIDRAAGVMIGASDFRKDGIALAV